jgi:hypothetical protein
MSLDRNYYLMVKENEKWETKESGGAYGLIASVFQHDLMPIQWMNDDQIKEMKESYAIQFGEGRYEFINEAWIYLSDFITMMDNQNLVKQIITSEIIGKSKLDIDILGKSFDTCKIIDEIDNEDLNQFLSTISKYKNLPREQVKLVYHLAN